MCQPTYVRRMPDFGGQAHSHRRKMEVLGT